MSGCIFSKCTKRYPVRSRNHVRKQETHWIWLDAGRGEVPKGMQINHHCDTPRCINIDHLYLGTHTDNMHDMIERGRGNFKGQISRENVRKIRQLSEQGLTQAKIGEMFNLAQPVISRIVNKRCWKNEEKIHSIPLSTL